MTTAIAAIKERPILFSGPMVRAILEKRKTQARRVITTPTPAGVTQWVPLNNAKSLWGWALGDGTWIEVKNIACPYGGIGDRLWVRETWLKSPADGAYWYRADKNESDFAQIYDYKWKPSIHMPREAARILLEVKNIRVERLQDISEGDAIAEGIQKFDLGPDSYALAQGRTVPEWFYGTEKLARSCMEKCPTEAFRRLWDSINRDRGYGWDSNPWVRVVDFELLTNVSQ